MSTENLYQGKIAEKLAEAFLLRWFTIAKPDVDVGVDEIGYLRMTTGSSVCHFQTKTGESFNVKAPTVDRLTSLVERQPVVFLHVTIHSLRVDTPRLAASGCDRLGV